MDFDKNSMGAMEEKLKEVQNNSKNQERMIRLNKKILLAILVVLIVLGLIESLMTGAALILINKDSLVDPNQDVDPLRDILIQGGEDDDAVSRQRRDHVKNVTNT